MYIDYSKTFKKRFKKLPIKTRIAFKKRLWQFSLDQFHSQLNNHILHGKYDGLRSINVTGNIRAIYDPKEKNTAYFIDIGSHSELYE